MIYRCAITGRLQVKASSFKPEFWLRRLHSRLKRLLLPSNLEYSWDDGHGLKRAYGQAIPLTTCQVRIETEKVNFTAQFVASVNYDQN